jgi:stage II sporulation protein M
LTRNNKLQESLSKHIKSNLGLYFIVFAFFAIGVAVGAFTVRALDDLQKQALIKYLQSFLQILTSKSIDSPAVLKQSIKNNIQTVFLIWILGITIIGIPITLIIMGIRGFIIGFTVGFLIDGLGLKGLFFAVLVILPQNIIIVPCLAAISVMSISFSLMIIKDRLAKRWTNNYWHKFFSYSTIVIVLFIISVCGSFVESYIMPVFIRLLSAYLS